MAGPIMLPLRYWRSVSSTGTVLTSLTSNSMSRWAAAHDLLSEHDDILKCLVCPQTKRCSVH